jgi:hypothetical protein
MSSPKRYLTIEVRSQGGLPGSWRRGYLVFSAVRLEPIKFYHAYEKGEGAITNKLHRAGLVKWFYLRLSRQQFKELFKFITEVKSMNKL